MRSTPSTAASSAISRARSQAPPFGAAAVVGVDVLAEQRDLARPRRRQAARLGHHLEHRARILGTARVGHDAEGAEPVASLLHGEEGGAAAALRRLRQVVELGLGREIGVQHDAAGAPQARHHLGQAVVGLGPEHHVHVGRPARDLGALGLGHAAGHGQDHGGAGAGAPLLQAAQATELREHLLRGLLADVAGVEDDHVGVVRARRRHEAEGRQDLGHAGRVVDVHLAAVGLDVKCLGQRRSGASSGRSNRRSQA